MGEDVVAQVEEYLGYAWRAPEKVYVRKPIRTVPYTMEEFFVTEQSVLECGDAYCTMMAQFVTKHTELTIADLKEIQLSTPAYMRREKETRAVEEEETTVVNMPDTGADDSIPSFISVEQKMVDYLNKVA